MNEAGCLGRRGCRTWAALAAAIRWKGRKALPVEVRFSCYREVASRLAHQRVQ